MSTIALNPHFGIDPFLAIDRAQLARSTTRQYKRAVELYLEAGNQLGNANQLINYASQLKPCPKAFLKSALKLWTKEVERTAKAHSTPETVNAVTATIHRLDSINNSIKVKRKKGEKIHNWLSGSQVKHLREVIHKERDYLIISLMLQAGLRRNEVVTLKQSDVQMLGEMHVLSVTGKGGKDRTIPITPELGQALTGWGEGDILFPLSGQAIMNICRK